MCSREKGKELRLESRRIHCQDRSQARTFLELGQEENRLDRVSGFGVEGEQSCLYRVRANRICSRGKGSAFRSRGHLVNDE